MVMLNGRFCLSMKDTAARYPWVSRSSLYMYCRQMNEAEAYLEKHGKFCNKFKRHKDLLLDNPFVKLEHNIFVDIEKLEKAPFMALKLKTFKIPEGDTINNI